jgi:hypothetical protein
MTTLQNTYALAVRAARGVLANDGATLATVAGLQDPTRGYVVADGRHETTETLEYPDSPELAYIDTRDAIARFVDSHRAALAQTGAYLGAWRDGNDVVLDVVNVLPERNVALNAARDRGERAIFALHTRELIWTRDHRGIGHANGGPRRLSDSHAV